jgi:hypothetical protein
MIAVNQKRLPGIMILKGKSNPKNMLNIGF